MELLLEECNITPVDTVLVGFSGGADSTALLMLLQRACGEGKIAGVCAAHLNHGLRGAEAEDDEAFCRDFCLAREIPFRSERADVRGFAKANKLSEETAAREVRYDFLNRVAVEWGASCIAVAHHRDDQAETVLMHLLRGCGLEGLCGMKFRSGRIVRPLLHAGREEIESFLGENGISFRTDSTNFLAEPLRNRVRLELMPLLKQLNPMATEHIAGTAELVCEDSRLLISAAEAALAETAFPGGGHDRERLNAFPIPVKTRAVRLLLEGHVAGGIERKDMDRVLALLSARSGTAIELRGGECAYLQGKALFIGRSGNPRVFETRAVLPGITVFPGGSFLSEESPFQMPKDTREAFVDFDRIPAETVVRTRGEGDTFHPMGAPGKRLLSDVMTDRKIPIGKRDIPLLATGGEILWMPGYTIAEKLRVTSQTKRVLHISFQEGKEQP